MKTLYVLFTALMLFAVQGCKSQTHEPAGTKQVPVAKPDIRYHVNKTYDEKGRMIGYDSVYTYSSTNVQGLNHDSLMKSFNSFKLMPGDLFKGKGSLLNDSLMNQFFRNDPFFKRSWDDRKLLFDPFSFPADSLKWNFPEPFHPGKAGKQI